MFDVLLQGGWVADGTGAPAWRADIGVQGEEIAAVGALDARHARTVVDVAGRVVMPGFVDAHVHGDALAADPDVQLAALRQGVTTFVLGQDGLSFAPASTPSTGRYVHEYFRPVAGDPPPGWTDGCTVAELLGHYDGATALNVAYLVPAGTVRMDVLGAAPGRPSADQLARMTDLVATGLAEGAVGVSSGLDYLPGAYADAAELAALCRPVAEAGGVYVTHMRGYEADAWVGIAEARRIALDSGVATHLSHLHGPSTMLTQLIAECRSDGVDLTFDSYPYLRGSSILAMVTLPADVQSAGPAATLDRLRDPATRDRLERSWFPGIADALDRVTLSYVGAEEWTWVEGLPLVDAAERAGQSPGGLVCELLVASRLAAGCVFGQPPTNTETDVRTLLRHEAHVAGSDGIYLGSRPHPRGWGTFARFLARHTRDLGDWTWGTAALHLAGHAARRFGLAGRGLLRPGCAADVAVVDPATVADRADYADPRRPAEGVSDVLVNGRFALREGQPADRSCGRALRHGAA